MKLFKSQHNERGQSLIEMAIAAPILIIFLLGIFEVGAAVRNYLTLVNVNREITRFAVRPGYLDFSTEATISASYAQVKDWASNAVSAQLDLDFSDTGDVNNTGNTTMIISHLVVDTGQPCEDMSSCNCEGFLADPPTETAYTLDDLILHPGMATQSFQAERFGPPETITGVRDTRLDYDALVDELAAQNNHFNCEIIKKGGIPSSNNVVVTELFIDQPQLFGFPFISNPYTDPVPLYSHTSMRLSQGARNYSAATTGPVCMAYPFTFQEDVFDDPDNPSSPQAIDAYEGDSPGTFGWITWNPDPGNNTPNYMADSIANPEMSLNDFINVTDPGDTGLSIGDDVSTAPGVGNSSEMIALLEALEGQTIIIPVYDVNYDSGSNAYYHITHFARITIDNICLPANGGDDSCGTPGSKRIDATFIEYVDDLCTEDGGVPPPPGGPPTALDDTATVAKGGNDVDIDVVGNDSDPDGDTLTINNVEWASGNPVRGSWTHDGTSITYTSDNQAGTYQLQYTIGDGTGYTATAMVTITVTP